MDLISSFFKRYNNIEPPERFVKEAIQEVLQEVFNVVIQPEHISLSKSTAFIEMSGPLKNEIFLRKQELLERINTKLKTHKKLIDLR